MRPWSQPVRALTWAIRPDSSVGQSSCLVNSRSSVRIRLRAPKPLQLQRSEHSSVCSINGRATLRATNPPGREWWRVVGAVETGPMETGYQPLPPPTTKTDCFWGFLIAGRICLTNNIQSSRAVKLFSIDRRSASRCPVPGARCPVRLLCASRNIGPKSALGSPDGRRTRSPRRDSSSWWSSAGGCCIYKPG